MNIFATTNFDNEYLLPLTLIIITLANLDNEEFGVMVGVVDNVKPARQRFRVLIDRSELLLQRARIAGKAAALAASTHIVPVNLK